MPDLHTDSQGLAATPVIDTVLGVVRLLEPKAMPAPTAGAPVRDWFVASVHRLEGVVELKENWDASGSPAPSASSLLAAIRVFCAVAPELPPQPAVVPVLGGGLQLEWHIGSRELEIEVLPEGDCAYLTVDGGQTDEGLCPADAAERLRGLIRWVMQA